ncbi:MAG: hypothetical protein HKN29_03750 [Rhodothermales bacterium]|nr:hypothetical protein [Rhodothermales bacterium]
MQSVDTSADRPIPSVNEQIAADHHAINAERSSLALLLRPEGLEDKDFEAWKLAALRRLRRFQATLLMHFDLEEVTAFKESVMAHAPHYASRLTQLEEEHLKIASDLDHVITLLKRTGGTEDPLIERLHLRLTGVLELLENHEEAERELFQSALYQDLGEGD